MPEYRLFSWGANSHKQLGLDNTEKEELLTPTEVDLSHLTDFNLEGITKIVGGAGHTLLLDRFGRVYICGSFSKNEKSNPKLSSSFQRINDLVEQKIIDVACGWQSSMALTENGQLFVWGSNSHGQLGLSSIPVGKISYRPLQVPLGVPIRRISMGLRHSAVITEDSKLLVSGTATKGQLGVDLHGERFSNKFIEVPYLRDIKDISCGQYHSVAITKHNELFVWGDNKYGQLGINPADLKIALTPMKIEKSFVDYVIDRIYCGWTHSAILTSDNNLFSWGRNSYGQLGRAHNDSKIEFWKAAPIISSKIQQLSVGSEHNIAITDEGAVLSWGWNEHGNCGNGNRDNVFEPANVMLPEGFAVLIGTGAGHSFAIVKMNC